MGVWWIVTAAVLLLALFLAGLGHWAGVWDLFWWTREDWDDDEVHGLLEADPVVAAPIWSDGPADAPALLVDLPSGPSGDWTGMGEPVDGDAYAAELHHIGELAAADVLELRTEWYPGRMPAWYPVAGGTLEEWERCLRWGQRRYWQARRREWAAETREWWADYREWRAEMGLAA